MFQLLADVHLGLGNCLGKLYFNRDMPSDIAFNVYNVIHTPMQLI